MIGTVATMNNGNKVVVLDKEAIQLLLEGGVVGVRNSDDEDGGLCVVGDIRGSLFDALRLGYDKLNEVEDG